MLYASDLCEMECLFVLRFYGPVNPMGSCRVPSAGFSLITDCRLKTSVEIAFRSVVFSEISKIRSYCLYPDTIALNSVLQHRRLSGTAYLIVTGDQAVEL